jgi:hypothetical protein
VISGQTAKTTNKQTRAAIPENAEAAPGVSAEERVIRRAYRKLSIYQIVEIFTQAKREAQMRGAVLTQPARRQLAQNVLRFELRDFRIGRIQEILNVKYKDLVTAPNNEIIQIGTGTIVNTVTNANGENISGEAKFSVNAKWKNGQYSPLFDQNVTMGYIMQIEALRFNDVNKFASYEVTASLQGKTSTYRALVLFHNPYQSSEPLNPDFLDSVAGMGGVLTEVFKETKLPVNMGPSSADDLTRMTGGNVRQKDGKENVGNMPAPDFSSGECTFSGFDFGLGCDCIDFDGSSLCELPIFGPVGGPINGRPVRKIAQDLMSQ